MNALCCDSAIVGSIRKRFIVDFDFEPYIVMNFNSHSSILVFFIHAIWQCSNAFKISFENYIGNTFM